MIFGDNLMDALPLFVTGAGIVALAILVILIHNHLKRHKAKQRAMLAHKKILERRNETSRRSSY